MRKLFYLTVIVLIGGIFIFVSHTEGQQSIKNSELNKKSQFLQPAGKPRLDVNFGKIPLYFISNQGQVYKNVSFYAKASRYTIWVTKEGLVFDITKRSEVRGQKSEKTKHTSLQRPNASTFQRDLSRLMFLGTNKNPIIVPINETKLRVNFFKGNDPSKWVGNVPTSQAVLYKNLYKNIDLKVYGIEKQIEYDWIVKPGGNPENIRFEYKNVKKTNIDDDGNLVITTQFGELIHRKPLSYQPVHVGADLRVCPSGNEKAKRELINSGFKKTSKNTYGFEVGEYDKSQPLIIDPLVLVYSTYLGGNANDIAGGIVIDSSGYVYIAGRTASTDFPTLNQYMSDPADSYEDAFVTKLDTTQSGISCLLYSSYFGGSDDDIGWDLVIDSNGYVYIIGETNSTDFPCLNQYMSDPGDSDYDAFVTKIDPSQSGTSSLLYSTYLGGNGLDEGYGIAADSSGNAYVTGSTESTDFPNLNQYQTDQSYVDGYVTKLDTTQSGSSCLKYSTYLGGGDKDDGLGIALGSSGNVFVTGRTTSSDFPTINQYQTDQASEDAFLTRIDTTQSGSSSLIYSTYLGGGSTELGYKLAADNSGVAYIVGQTNSTDYPVLNQFMSDPGDGTVDAFVTKIDTAQSGSSSFIYSTYLGGNGWDWARALAVDSSSNVYVTGYTESTDFPVRYQYQTVQGNGDTFISKVDTTKSGTPCLIYSTYLGASDRDSGTGVAFDSSGKIYVTGYSDSIDFPTLNQYMTDPGDSDNDGFVTKLTMVTLGVTSPNGGEDWTINTTHNITWDATGLSNPLYIILQQNGVNVALIQKNIDPSLGTYSWTVGDYRQGGVVANTNCKILLKHKDFAVKDKSDAVFTISNPYVTVTAPNGGEDWQIGTTENITWDSAGLTNTLYIVLQQNGVNVALIQKIIDPSLGTYSWSVGDCRLGIVVAGTNYKIILKEKDSTVKDKSNGGFVISN